jgi:hypothetical protein
MVKPPAQNLVCCRVCSIAVEKKLFAAVFRNKPLYLFNFMRYRYRHIQGCVQYKQLWRYDHNGIRVCPVKGVPGGHCKRFCAASEKTHQ